MTKIDSDSLEALGIYLSRVHEAAAVCEDAKAAHSRATETKTNAEITLKRRKNDLAKYFASLQPGDDFADYLAKHLKAKQT